MIVRILGEGQFEVPEQKIGELRDLDEAVAEAVDTADREKYTQCVSELVAGIHRIGRRLPSEHLGPSDLVLPGPHTSLEEVRDLLREEGLLAV